MINKRNGAIEIIPGGPIIDPKMSERNFNKLNYPKSRRKENYQINYKKHYVVYYTLEGHDKEGNEFNLFIEFKKEPKDSDFRLRCVFLNHFPNLIVFNDFFEKITKAEKWHNKWMQKNPGSAPEINFPWGKIYSSIEIKTPMSQIIISYGKKN